MSRMDACARIAAVIDSRVRAREAAEAPAPLLPCCLALKQQAWVTVGAPPVPLKPPCSPSSLALRLLLFHFAHRWPFGAMQRVFFFFFLFFPCPQHACLISIDKCRLGRTLAGPPVKIHIINKSISTCAPGCRCLTLTCKLDFLPIWYAYFTHRFMAVTRPRPDLAFRETDGITKGMIF